MEVTLKTEAPPLSRGEDGTLRVGNSRVLLDLIIHAFEEGATPEIIVQKYPTTTLADIYGVIAYYLRHQNEVNAYLAAREQQAAEVRKRIEAQQGDMADIRERLLARKRAMES